MIDATFPARLAELCPAEEITQDSVLDISLLSTSNETVTAHVLVQLTTPWLTWKSDPVQENKFETFGNLTFAEPVIRKSFFSRDILKNDESILITVEAEPGSDCFCNLVSVQQPDCPYFDSVSTAVRYGIWQTMMNKTALQIQASDFTKGYLIVVVATETDDFCEIKKEENKCGERRNSNLPLKMIRITESVNTNSHTTWKANLIIIGVYAVIVIFSLGLSIALFHYDMKLFDGMKEMIAINQKKKLRDIKKILPYGNINSAFESTEDGESDGSGEETEKTGHADVELKESYAVDKDDITAVEAINYSRLKSNLPVSAGAVANSLAHLEVRPSARE